MVSSSPRSLNVKQSRLSRDKAAPFLIGAGFGLLVLTCFTYIPPHTSASSPATISTAPPAPSSSSRLSSLLAAVGDEEGSLVSPTAWKYKLSSYVLGSEKNGKYEWVTKPLPKLEKRAELGAMLEAEGMLVGAELGVQSGAFAEETLETWKSCEKYYVIDVWRHVPSGQNYIDEANRDDAAQTTLYYQTKDRLAKFQKERGTDVVPMPMMGREAVRFIADKELDYMCTLFVVEGEEGREGKRESWPSRQSEITHLTTTQTDIDARHDYCGVKEDIEMYWPKLREGGILSGHDYVNVAEAPRQGWEFCEGALPSFYHPSFPSLYPLAER